MILFDTDVCLSLLGGNSKIIEKFGSSLEEICVPSLCIPELYLAAEQSAHPEQNLQIIERFLTTVRILYPDSETYRYAARLQNTCDRQGRTVPQNEILIFCLSRIHSARLVTLHAGRYRFT